MRFVHLHTHSHYSLLDGLPKIDELIKHTKALGMDAVALTDHGNLYGAIEFYKAAKAHGIKPIMGVEAYLAPNGHEDKNKGTDEKYHHLTLLVKDNVGWKNLIKLVTESHLRGFYYKPRMDKALLRQYGAGLIALSGCLTGEISKKILADDYEGAKKAAVEYEEIFGQGNFFLEIGHHPGVEKTLKTRDDIIKLSKETGIPLAATQDIHYLTKEDAQYQDILLAVQTGNNIGDSDRLTLKQDDFSMRSPEEMTELFRDLPEAIENTAKIADMCRVEIELGKIRLPRFPVPDGAAAKDYLRELIDEKTGVRYEEVSPEIKARIDMELGVIERMGFSDYFLIVQDFINWAKERGIVVGPGRGSAAGSIISYILGITDIDPLKYDLLFERFLNPSRIQMPDIDIDITDLRRDEVLGYLKEKYGENHVAHIITFGTMAARAAVRDVGRALGMSYSFCDQLAKLIPFNLHLKDAIAKVPELADQYERDDEAKRLLDSALHLEGVARHASVHACGIVLTHEPLTEYLPLQRAPQDPNTIVSQFEMHSVEDLGLLKIDLLGLRNLTIIEGTVKLIDELKGEKIDITKLPLNDKKTFKLLQDGMTTSVFQLESAGMTRHLKDLKPTDIEDIIIMISLYRPGPMELIPDYIARKHGKKQVTYLHPKLEPILKNTFGIMIFQEQLMQAAQALAGFTLAEADVLRKAVGKKIRKLLQEQKEKLIQGCLKNGVSQKVAEAFWELIEPFDRYGFNRCLTGDTKIMNPENGELCTLNNLHQKKKIIGKVVSLEETLKLNQLPVSNIIYNGQKPVYRVTTKSGRQIKATQNHPLLTAGGWRKLEEIKTNDKIAVPRRLSEPDNPLKIERHKLELLGYLLAEGNFCHPNGFYFYSKSEDEISDYLSALEKFNNTVGKIDRSKSAVAVYSKRKDIHKPSGAVTWIESLGLKYKKATEKFFPDFVYQLSNNDLKILIAKMFQGDGCINFKRKDPQIFYATSSSAIAQGLQHLLLRLGILSTIHEKKFKYRGGIKPGFTVSVSRYDNIDKFMAAFLDYLVGEKTLVAKKIINNHPILIGMLPAWAARGSYDVIPASLAIEPLRSSVTLAGFNFREFERKYNISYRLFLHDKKKIGYLRETIGNIAEKLNDKNLHRLAESDIYWDGIKKIEYVGIEDTYDLTVPKTHNFVANDIIVHNSHGASYAMIAYETAYLKTHYPVEFMTSVLNAESGDVERAAFLINESKKMGIEVFPPDINMSQVEFTPEAGNIRFGLLAIKNVGANIVAAIIEERARAGPFSDFGSFLGRVKHKDLNKKSLESLIKCGALDSLGTERNKALQNIEEILKFAAALKRQSANGQSGLFGSTFSPQSLKLKDASAATPQEKLAWEKELLGLYITDHPLNRFKTKIENAKAKPIKEILNGGNGRSYISLAGVISKINRVMTKTGKQMLFAKCEDLNDSIEVVVFPETLMRNQAVWRENNAVLILGKMSPRNGEQKIICESITEL